MIGQEAMRSRHFLTTIAILPHWGVLILFVATALVQDGTPQDTSLALIWSTKVAADGRGSIFFLYGDPNSYRDRMQRNETISSTIFVTKSTDSSKYMAMETRFAQSQLYYSDSAGYLGYGPVNVSGPSYLAYNLNVPAVSNLVTGLSVDWVSNLIYWSDAIYQRICVVDANRYLFWRPVVESGLSFPQDVAVYPQQGFLFWTDSSLKIERLVLANNSRQVVVTSDYLQRPTTLVIDFVTQRLLWLDSGASRIGFVNFDGSNRSFWSMQLFSSISSFVIFKGFFFLGDKTQPKSYAYNFTNRIYVGYVTAEARSGVIDMTAFAPEKQPSFASPCSLNNGGCNHFCITKSSTESVCKCAMGFFLDSYGTTCNPALLEDNFLLVSDQYQYNIFQVDLGNGEVLAASVTPAGLFPITAMDYDPVSKTVYGFDSDKNSIRKVTLDNHETSTVLQLQAKEISSLAVDAVGRMLYYVNFDSGAIMRATLSGYDHRPVVSGDGTLATAIALDLLNRLMFWSDCSVGRRSIEKAQISNPSNHQSVVGIFGSCARAIATDFSNELIYWADNTGRIEQVGYNGARRLLIRQLSSTSSINGLAVDSNSVFISDSNQRQIQRINRNTSALSNLTGIRFSRPYAITLFRSATWFMITNASPSTSSITPAFGSTSASTAASTRTASTSSSTSTDSFTTIILASVISGAVVLVAVIVTVGIVLSKKCRKKPSIQQGGVYESSIPSVYDTINYTSLQNGATRLRVERQLQGNRSECRNDPASGPYELNDVYFNSQFIPQGCQRSSIYAPIKKPSDPPPAYEPKEDHEDHL